MLGTMIRWNPFTWLIRAGNASTTRVAAPMHAAAASPPPIQ